jgi:4-amino-4-deoxy-L-arabinose transferase-like glycosyltransferase
VKVRWLWLLPLLLTFWLGARGLNIDTLRGDELSSIQITHDMTTFTPLSPADVWHDASQDAVHPPGYYLLLNGWARLVGIEAAALRGLSLFLGILTLAWVYRLGADLASRQAAFYALIILGTSVYFARYLHEMRMYTLTMLMIVMLLWFYLRIIDGSPKRWHWIGLFVSALGAIYAHYFAALFLGTIGLFHLFQFRRLSSGRFWGVIVIFAIAGILFLPWVTILLDGMDRKIRREENVAEKLLSPLEILQQTWFAFANTNMLFALVLAPSIGLMTTARGTRRIGLVAVAFLLAILAANQYVVQVIEDGNVRYMLPLWPLLALLVAFGLFVVTRWRQPVGQVLVMIALVVWVGSGIYFSVIERARFDPFIVNFKSLEAQRLLRDDVTAGDYVVAYVPDRHRHHTTRSTLNYYFRNLNVDTQATGTVPAGWDQEDAYFLPFEHSDPEQARLWVLDVPSRATSTLAGFESALSSLDYAVCTSSLTDGELRARLWAKSPACCAADGHIAQFGNLVTLNGLDVTPQADGWLIGSAWQMSPGTPPDTYSVSFQVFDPAGAKVAQVDDGLANVLRACKRLVISIEDAEPGLYEIRATVYEWRTGERLPGRLVDSEGIDDLLPVGSFTAESKEQPNTKAEREKRGRE